jgi:sterol desaturase/sphingolipid hydroxylase (fatty acid hydroxylase superfamily)
MSEVEFQIVKSVGFVLALMAALGLQWLRPHAAISGSWRVNAMLWAVDAALVGLVCGACACTVSRWAAMEGFGLLNLFGSDASPLWLAIPLSVLALDFVSYGWHRANHVLPLLWRFHQVHHSDPSFTTTTALRFHPGELLLSIPLRLAAVAGLGVPIVGVIVFEVYFAFQNMFEHGNIDLPAALEKRLAWLFVTPALHRRHHSRRLTELNSNYGTIFTFWDRSLGTFGESSSRTSVRTGLPGAVGFSGLGGALALPFRDRLRGDD